MITLLASIIAQLQTLLASSQTEWQALIDARDAATSERDSLRGQVEGNAVTIDSLNQQSAALQTQVSGLSAEIQALRNTDIEQERSQWLAERSLMQSTISDKDAQLAGEGERTSAAVTTALQNQSQGLVDLQAQVSGLQSQLSTVTSERDEALARLAQIDQIA